MSTPEIMAVLMLATIVIFAIVFFARIALRKPGMVEFEDQMVNRVPATNMWRKQSKS